MFQRISSLLNATASAGSVPKPSAALDYPTAVAGNPFVDGWYADPDTEIYNGKYWVFPTTSDVYENQTYLDAFSSPDLINWTKHPNILTVDGVKWATKAVWAPAPIARNGKYYLYFGANDIQEDEDEAGMVGGIGVAVANEPEGPYIDAIGEPLIGHYHNAAQPIDQDVFIDDKDGQAYIYYGGHSHANVAKLNEDMISVGTFDDDSQFKEITPENYVEGSQMIKRNGIYYFMWSEGGWTGPDYSVSYAMSDSPLGPFVRKDKILQQDSAVAKGSGHHGVINIPDTDIWYIVYHRRPLSESDGNHRVLAFDRMYFNDDGTIAPVHMLVQDNFADGNMIGWKTYGGDWSVLDECLSFKGYSTGLAMLDTNFTSLVFDATVSLARTKESDAEAGLVFRVSGLDKSGGFDGYFAGLSASGGLILSSTAANHTDILAQQSIDDLYGHEHKLRVVAEDSSIRIYLDDLDTAKLEVEAPEGPSTGSTGVRAHKAAVKFGNISITKPASDL
ncbi:putative 3-keto-disaccharide hydrolase domain-containing protein [Seiridium unicorne]|uniref:3-keto-disaccharide hydrolase domain-containing protein n=1 Tax=Seiridium unicorne TaxID=138068 RepID=A0ABR2UP99_9PEZI